MRESGRLNPAGARCWNRWRAVSDRCGLGGPWQARGIRENRTGQPARVCHDEHRAVDLQLSPG